MACERLICGTTFGNDAGATIIQTPVPGYIYSPYVKIGLGGKAITIGNDSQPGSDAAAAGMQSQGLIATTKAFNTAVISSFEYGFECQGSGFNCNFEILDAGGTTYLEILKHLNKTVANSKEDTNGVWFDFGWIISKPDGNDELRSVLTLFDKVLRGVPSQTNLTFENGNVKIKFQVTSPMTYPVVHDGVFGRESNPMPLKEALRELFTQTDPKVNVLVFQNKDGTGEWECEKSVGGIKGPQGIWKMNQQDKLNAARSWLNHITSSDGRSFIFIYEGFSGVDDPITKLIIKEAPDIETNTNCCGNCLATFIVNGGNDSPVISFTPQINFNFGDVPSGQVSPGAGNSKQEDLKQEFQIQRAGTMQAVSVAESMWDFVVPEQHAEKTRVAVQAANIMATTFGAGTASPFEAELKIFGDPQFCSPVGSVDDQKTLIGRTLSILFINPFTPKTTVPDMSGAGRSFDWLSNPSCNEVITNKNYLILKVNHQISGGMFVTSFKLKCLLPNVDIPVGLDTVGGSEGCGVSIKNLATKYSGKAEPIDAAETPSKKQ